MYASDYLHVHDIHSYLAANPPQKQSHKWKLPETKYLQVWGCDLWPWELMGRVGQLVKIAFLCIEKQSASAICGKKKKTCPHSQWFKVAFRKQGKPSHLEVLMPFKAIWAQCHLDWLCRSVYFPSYHKYKKTAITYCALYSVHKFSPKSHLRPNPPLWIL